MQKAPGIYGGHCKDTLDMEKDTESPVSKIKSLPLFKAWQFKINKRTGFYN